MKWDPLLQPNRQTCRPLVSDDAKLIFLAAVPLSIHIYSTQSSLPISSYDLPDPHQNSRLVNILRHPISPHQLIVLVASNGSIFIFDYINHSIKHTYDTHLPDIISSSIRHPSLISSSASSSLAPPSNQSLTLFLVTHKSTKPTAPKTDPGPIEHPPEQPIRIKHPNRNLSVIYAINLVSSSSPSAPQSLDRAPNKEPQARSSIEKIKLLKTSDPITTSSTSACGNWLGIVTGPDIWIIRLKVRDLFEKLTDRGQSNKSKFEVLRLAAPETITAIAFPPKIHADHFSSSAGPTSINVSCTPRDFFATGSISGKIALWHALSETQWNGMIELSLQTPGIAQPCPTSLSHWHAHPVADLQFTKNGAHLLSGGEEGVLVLWKLDDFGATAFDSKSYLPRLGTQIQTISLIESVDGNQPGALLTGHDGLILIIGTAAMSLLKTLKLPMMHKLPHLYEKSSSSIEQPVLIPIASPPSSDKVDKPYGNLLVRSSHPCGLQVVDGGSGQVLEEILVKPMNLISRRGGGRPIVEPKLLFVALGGIHDRYMATIDSWVDEDRGFSPEITLKLWDRDDQGNSFGFHVIARVDNPHDDSPITSLKLTTELIPKLITTSMDGTIKIWTSSMPPTDSNSNATADPTRASPDHLNSKKIRFENLKSIKLNFKRHGISKSLISKDNSILITLHDQHPILNIISIWDLKNFKLLKSFNFNYHHPSLESAGHHHPNHTARKSIIKQFDLAGPKDQFIFVLCNTGCSLIDLLTGSERAFWSCRPRFMVKTPNEAKVLVVHKTRHSGKEKGEKGEKKKEKKKKKNQNHLSEGSTTKLVMTMIDLIEKKTNLNVWIKESSRLGTFIDIAHKSRERDLDGLILVTESAGLIRCRKPNMEIDNSSNSKFLSERHHHQMMMSSKIESELGIKTNLPFQDIFKTFKVEQEKKDSSYLEMSNTNSDLKNSSHHHLDSDSEMIDQINDADQDEFKLEIERFVNFSPHLIPSSKLIWNKLIKPIELNHRSVRLHPSSPSSSALNSKVTNNDDSETNQSFKENLRLNNQKSPLSNLFEFNQFLISSSSSYNNNNNSSQLQPELIPLKLDEIL